MTLTVVTVDNLLREYGPALAQEAGVTLADVDVRHSVASVGGWHADYTLRLELAAGHRVDVDRLALEHAADSPAFVRAVVDRELRPFAKRVRAAARAANAAWQQEIAKPA